MAGIDRAAWSQGVASDLLGTVAKDLTPAHSSCFCHSWKKSDESAAAPLRLWATTPVALNEALLGIERQYAADRSAYCRGPEDVMALLFNICLSKGSDRSRSARGTLRSGEC
jgi:hypothetical protein